MATPTFDVLEVTEDGTCHLRLVGELDVAARAAVEDHVRSSAGLDLEIDLSGLTFIDCSGYASLADLARAAAPGGRRVRVTAAREQPLWFLSRLHELGIAAPGVEVTAAPRTSCAGGEQGSPAGGE